MIFSGSAGIRIQNTAINYETSMFFNQTWTSFSLRKKAAAADTRCFPNPDKSFRSHRIRIQITAINYETAMFFLQTWTSFSLRKKAAAADTK
jgi:hypothetical protein